VLPAPCDPAQATQAPGANLEFINYQQRKAPRFRLDQPNRMAGILAGQRLGQKSPLYVSRGGRELVEATSSGRDERPQSDFDGIAESAGAESSCHAAQRRLANQGRSAQYCKKNPAILAHSDDLDRAQ